MFQDREDAARQLAEKLKGRELHDPLVLAIPRGGVVTGVVLARELDAELDVVMSRKLRHPWQPELALGAVSESGHMVLNPQCSEDGGVSDEYLHAERIRQLEQNAMKKLKNAMQDSVIAA